MSSGAGMTKRATRAGRRERRALPAVRRESGGGRGARAPMGAKP